MRAHYYDLVPKIANDPSPDRFSAEVIKADLYMSLWYGELYVVIEGWKELAPVYELFREKCMQAAPIAGLNDLRLYTTTQALR